MARNTKTAGKSSDRSDRQHLWLSLLLIFTCICLITAILIISFFIYREIDRRAVKLDNTATDRAGMYKGQYKVTSTGRTIFHEATPTTPMVITLPKTTRKIIPVLRPNPIKYTALNTSAKPIQPLREETVEMTWSTSTSATMKHATQSKFSTSTLKPTIREVIISSSTPLPGNVEVVTASKTTTIYSSADEASSFTSSTISSTKKIKMARFRDAIFPDMKTASSRPSSIPKKEQATRPSTASTVSTVEKWTSPKTSTTTSFPEKVEVTTSIINNQPESTQNNRLWPVTSTAEEDLALKTTILSSNVLDLVTLQPINAEENIESSSISSLDEETIISKSNSSLENEFKEQIITFKKRTDLDDSIVFRDDDFSIKPEAEKIVKETHTYVPIKKSSKMKNPFLAKYRDVSVDGRKTSGGTITLSKNTTKRLHHHNPGHSGYSATKVEDIVTNVSNKQQQYGPITSTTTNVTRVVSSVSSPENAKYHLHFNEPRQDSTGKEVKSYYVKTVETAPTTIIKYYENGVLVPMKVCDTITCKLSASKMVALIDHNSDPCEDFFSYACGGIALNRLKNPQYDTVILEKIDSMDPLDKYSEKFKTFFNSCTNFNASCDLSALKQLIDDTFHINAKDEKRDVLTAIIIKMMMLDPMKASFGLLPIFDIRMELDVNGLMIPTLTIPNVNEQNQIDRDCMAEVDTKDMEEKRVKSIYEKYTKCTQEISRHVKGLYQKLQELSVGSPLPDDIEKIVDLIATIPKSVDKRTWNEEILSMDQNPIYLSIEDLDGTYPEINWNTLFKALFRGNESKIQKVRIMFKEQMDALFMFYRKKSISDLLQTLRIIFTIDAYITIVKDYDRMNIKEYCLKKSVGLMEDLAANMLVKSANKKDLQYLEDIAKHMFSTTKVQFKASIRNSSWLNDSMQKAILSVLDKIQLVASATNPLFNEPLLNYRNEKMKINNNFIQNLISIKHNKRTIMYDKIENNPDKVWMFDYNPLSTEVWTKPSQFEVVLPQGLLLHLMYKKRRSPQIYELYSKLGFQIARGIATYFEPSKLKKLLPGVEENEVYKNYLHVRLGDPQIAKAINKFEIMAEKEDLSLNQDLRFADDLTIRLSIDTYNRTDASTDLQFLWLNYTIPQLFYLTMAQEFCKPENTIAELAVSLYEDVTLPNFFRVNSLLMNSIGFSDAYHCPLGSAMNPTLKSDAFPYITYTEIDYL